MNFASNMAQHPALRLRARVSSRHIVRSASPSPASTTREPARIRRRSIDGDDLVTRWV